MPLVVLNFVIAIVVMPAALLALLPASSFDWRALPTPATLARDVTVWLLVQEVTFFYVHRWLHENKKMYARIHKLHHTWTAPISVVAIYAHPFEHVVSNLLPPFAGIVLVRAHVSTLFIHTIVGIIHTQAVHSGYFFCDDNGMHDEHHRSFNVNYGVFGILDWYYGSYVLPPTAAPNDASVADGAATKQTSTDKAVHED